MMALLRLGVIVRKDTKHFHCDADDTRSCLSVRSDDTQ